VLCLIDAHRSSHNEERSREAKVRQRLIGKEVHVTPGHPACVEPFSEGTHSFPADVAQNEYFPRTILCSLSTVAYGSSPAFKLSPILPPLVAASGQQDTELQLRVFSEHHPSMRQ
jgi:hypothetical protein